jgi:hypothetical protein
MLIAHAEAALVVQQMESYVFAFRRGMVRTGIATSPNERMPVSGGGMYLSYQNELKHQRAELILTTRTSPLYLFDFHSRNYARCACLITSRCACRQLFLNQPITTLTRIKAMMAELAMPTATAMRKSNSITVMIFLHRQSSWASPAQRL